MNTPNKRSHSPAEGERCTKRAKSSHAANNAVIAEPLAQQHSDNVQVVVKLRSTSKAALNDPELSNDWEKSLLSTLSGNRNADDRRSTSSEDGQVISYTTYFPTPVQPHSPAVSDKPEPSASVDNPHSHVDGSTTGHVEDRSCSSDHIPAHSDDIEDIHDGFDDMDDDERDFGENCDSSERYSLDDFSEWNWLDQIDGIASVDHNQVADCDAKLIWRWRIRNAFWTAMEEPSVATSDLAFELFDRYGRLNREYYDHEFRKGSGTWGPELNHGDILLFESLNIKLHWQHQGIGAKVVNAILEKARSMSSGFFAFVQPGYHDGDLNYDWEDAEEDSMTSEKYLAALEQFWRSLGFRRVGASEWFAFADDDSHSSRHLDAAQDWDEPEREKEKEPIREPFRTVLNSLYDPSALDGECVRQLQETFPIEANAPSPMYVDESGNTILHLAAVSRKAETVAYILAKYPHLKDLRNAKGHTALEALQSSLEEHRTRRRFIMATTVISDDFKGFSSSEIACLAALTGTEIIDIAELSNRDISATPSVADSMVSMFPKINTIRHTLRLKYGCTCGDCLEGFLSPKTRFALLCQAQYRHDTLSDALHASGSEWVAMNAPELVYLTTPVRENMETNKSMRQGFTNMCKHIARCLEKKRVPNEETVLHLYRNETTEWPPVTAHYLQQGGTVAAVVMMLFNHAMHCDEWAGNGTHLDSHEDEIKKLPVCRNDHEFGFVSGMCGYKRISMVRYVDLFGREIGAC